MTGLARAVVAVAAGALTVALWFVAVQGTVLRHDLAASLLGASVSVNAALLLLLALRRGR